MKIRVLSDLHLEFCDWVPPAGAEDVVVLAGDIDIGARAIAWARRSFEQSEIVYVAGNHEFFGTEVDATLDDLRETSRKYAVRFLECDSVVIAGTRFLGTTLWTDFELYGRRPMDAARAMSDALEGMRDYNVIRVGAEDLRPEHTRAFHAQQVRWLEQEIGMPFAGSTVIVTHHLPHPTSIHPRYAGDRTNPAFASDLSHLVRHPVNLWIHGHTHESLSYSIDSTRVVCNPRGYLPHDPNRAFDPCLVAEIT